MWLRVNTLLLAVFLLLTPTLASVCPDGCVCITTRDGLHRATCSNLKELYKFTQRQKHHNINILDLSHNNITKITHELDRLTEIVTLDLSTNGITIVNKFLHNAKKLVHLNLAHNRIETLSVSYLPTSVSSLDLTNNLLQDVPSDLVHLTSLEHLELQGNPLNCSCENILARDVLLLANVLIDKVKCSFPTKLKGRSWLELKTKDICKVPKLEHIYQNVMTSGQYIDAIQVGEQATALKPMPLQANSDLNIGAVISHHMSEDDDNHLFMKVKRSALAQLNAIEGSGDIETSTNYDMMQPRQNLKDTNEDLKKDDVLPVHEYNTEIPFEGSGQGSGSGDFPITFNEVDDNDGITETTEAATTTPITEFAPAFVERMNFDDNIGSSTEFPMPVPPSVYQGDPKFYEKIDPPTTIASVTPILRDTTISEHIRVTRPSENLGAAPTTDKTAPHKTGTYVCIAIIVVLLVGLIGFAIGKGQMRKRRDRRLLRQQKRDVEKASKEMVDMNKSLLGKPAAESPIEKKINGKYELVPTHEVLQKKSENGDIANGNKYKDKNGERTDSPRDTNQNKSSSKDNNLSEDNHVPVQETSFESVPDSRKDTSSLSSEDIFVPTIDEDTPRQNGNADPNQYPGIYSNLSQPLLNGDQTTDSDFLSPSREYVPVYSPDMGRVRIKMAETAKPKTPVLVTRSRSNAGDIIITPMDGDNVRKSTT